jgi:ribosomal protein S18 acetylase RimI-like enzyme
MFQNEPTRENTHITPSDWNSDGLTLPRGGIEQNNSSLSVVTRCTTRRVSTEFDPASSEFTKLYCEAFAGPPYYETFTDDDVLTGVWNSHLRAGEYVLVTEVLNPEDATSRLIGLVCGHGALSHVEPKIKEFLLGLERDGLLPAPLEQTLFISELCVDPSARKKGLGTSLTIELLKHASADGYTHWMTRTAAEGSNSLRIFKGLGGTTFGPLHRVGESIATASNERVYLCGDLTQYALK